MTMTDQSASLSALVARIDERILAPIRRNPRARQWFAVTVAAILALHGGILAFLLYRDTSVPQLVAKQEPAPIEIVVEKPKEEPKPPQKQPEPPKPAAKQEIEKPASSAPRAPNQEKVDTAATDKETHAPKAVTPPKDGKPEPVKEAAAPATEAAEPEKQSEEAAAKPDVLQKDAEALDKAKAEPKKVPEKKVAKVTKPKPKHVKTALQQLAGASNLPDYKFARPTKKSPVYGGSEDSRYLAIVYGMIMRNRARIAAPGGDGGNVTISFNVDGDGNLIGMGIERTSGYPALDAAAVAAIRRASPFPPPPAGAPHGLIATIAFGEDEPAYTMGSRDR